MPDKNRNVELVTVVEGLNETLQERFLGITMLLAEELQSRVERRVPPVPGHWSKCHAVVFRCLAYAVPRSEALEFADRHAKSNPRPGWKDLLDLA